MSSLSPAVKMNKTTTSLPPISDIFRGHTMADTYYPPQSYATHRNMPPVSQAYPSPPYHIPAPDQIAPRYYGAPYPVPAFGFAGKTGFGDGRESWRQGVEAQHQIPAPPFYQAPPQLGQRAMSAGSSTPEFVGSQSSSRELSPKMQHMSASQSKVRTRNNLPKEVTNILLKWLNEHLNHPYPNSFEKAQLIIATGLNQQQLSNWFINARRRKIKSLREKRDSYSS